MALGMTYVQAIEAAGGIPVVVPALADRDVPRISLASTGSFSQEGRTSPPRPTGPGLTVQLGVTEPRSMALSTRWLGRLPAGAADPGYLPRRSDAQRRARRHLHQHLPDVVGDAITHRTRHRRSRLAALSQKPPLLIEGVGSVLTSPQIVGRPDIQRHSMNSCPFSPARGHYRQRPDRTASRSDPRREGGRYRDAYDVFGDRPLLVRRVRR